MTLESIARNKVALKSPLTTRSVVASPRSTSACAATSTCTPTCVRPTFPNTKSRFDNVDLITVRENTEGAYLAEGQEVVARRNRAPASPARLRAHRALRLKSTGRKKVTAVHKANIIKSTSGLFLNVAREVAAQYPEIEFQEMIVDNCCMQLVMRPEQFDVIVTTNLFGDIISDLCAGLVGGLGLAPGANIGKDAAIFEAVHGTAPDIAGQGKANPCALLLAAAQMLDHVGQPENAERLRKAIVATMEAKDSLTGDLGGTGTTMSFAQAIASRLRPADLGWIQRAPSGARCAGPVDPRRAWNDGALSAATHGVALHEIVCAYIAQIMPLRGWFVRHALRILCPLPQRTGART